MAMTSTAMAAIGKISKKVRDMFDISEPTAELIYDLAWWITIGAAAFAFLGAIVQFKAEKKLGEFREIRDQKTELEIANANATAATANEGQAKANAEAAKANEGLALANERAAALEKEAATAKLELEKLKERTKPWLLSDDVRERLTDRIREIPIEHEIQIGTLVNAEGAGNFAIQLRSIFRDAGKKVRGENTISIPAAGTDLFGVQMTVNEEDLHDQKLNRLWQSLIEAGIPVAGAKASPDKHIGRGEFEMTVGRRPRNDEGKAQLEGAGAAKQ
jgi:hypothetical protein